MQLSQPPRLHPLIAAAAAAIIVVCMLGVAVLAYMLPFRKDGGGGLALLISRSATPAPAVVQLPATIGLPVGLGPTGSVVVTVSPTTSASPGASPPSTSSTTSARPVQSQTAPIVPAFDVPELPAATSSPVQISEPDSAVAQAKAVPATPHKAKGLSAARLNAAHRATNALAHGRTPESGAGDEQPAKLRPEQLEAARRATEALAEAMREQAAQQAP